MINDPLVLLPGMMCDARLFTPQIHAFSHQRSVINIPLTGSDSIPELAQKVLEQTPPIFALAGLSMGGIVAMEVIKQAPQRVTRIALLDTNHLADDEERKATRQRQIKKVLGGKLREVMQDELKPNYLSTSSDTTALLSLCMDMAETLGANTFESQSLALMTRHDQIETLKSINVPALILCGEDDSLCPVERHQAMQELIRKAELVVIEKAGHMPTLEQADATTNALNRWLNLADKISYA